MFLFTSCSKDKEVRPDIQNGVTVTLTFEDGSVAQCFGAVKKRRYGEGNDAEGCKSKGYLIGRNEVERLYIVRCIVYKTVL